MTDITRRSMIAGVVAYPTLSLSDEPSDKVEPDAVARLKAFAELSGTELPQLRIDACGQLQLTDELHEYLVEEGLSFDWVFRGDVRAMLLVHRSHYRRSPVLELFSQHRALCAWMNDLPDHMTDHEMDPHYARLRSIEAEMMALPSETAGDFAAKAIVETADGTCLLDWEISKMWAEARSLTKSV